MARHTLATQLKAGGVTVQNIMDVLNHKDVRSSLHYQGDGTIEVERSSLLARRRPAGRPNKAASA